MSVCLFCVWIRSDLLRGNAVNLCQTRSQKQYCYCIVFIVSDGGFVLRCPNPQICVCVCVGAELMNFDKIFLASWNLRVREYFEYREVCPYMVICSGLRRISLKQGWISRKNLWVTLTQLQREFIVDLQCQRVLWKHNYIENISRTILESLNVSYHYQRSRNKWQCNALV